LIVNHIEKLSLFDPIPPFTLVSSTATCGWFRSGRALCRCWRFVCAQSKAYWGGRPMSPKEWPSR